MPDVASALPEDRVKAIAYTLWLEEGQPEGRADAHWFRALELATSEVPLETPKRKPTARKKKTTQ